MPRRITNQQLAIFRGTIAQHPRFYRYKGRRYQGEGHEQIMSGLLATVLSASFAVAQIVPVNAQPIYVPLGQNVSSDVQTVQDERWRWRNRDFSRRDFRRNFFRRDFRRFARNDDFRYYRGYRYYRPGYRRYGDFWFPLAAHWGADHRRDRQQPVSPRLSRRCPHGVVLQPLQILPGL
ncbi:hypothetical protein BQ8794_90190 [Mesorhizobium prunaredense]|uniref:BA14K family protein n=1 Tax=Mesorhizobium prunaredense TaxID=1631249 RepID=A0A1R3VJK6_9HYPH|nr:hypothetical protein BQ8794_90190 [Mesorhizobium prunaredense]